LNINDNPLHFEKSKDYGETIMSLLIKKDYSVDYSVNNFRNGEADFSFVYLDANGLKVLDDILDNMQTANTSIFIVAPVFKEYAEKAVNINNFLREKEIIETDTEGTIVWENSLAYQKEYGHLWLNLIGREPKGAVSPGEDYNEVREALIKGITEKLIDSESSQAIIDRIYKKEELFNGENLIRMPDLIVTLRQAYGFSHFGEEITFDDATVSSKRTKTYIAGKGIMSCDNIRRDPESKDLPIAAIAPLILYCLGCSIPASMDGKVEADLFDNGFISENPPKYENKQTGSELSQEDEELIIERLRGLGYVE